MEKRELKPDEVMGMIFCDIGRNCENSNLKFSSGCINFLLAVIESTINFESNGFGSVLPWAKKHKISSSSVYSYINLLKKAGLIKEVFQDDNVRIGFLVNEDIMKQTMDYVRERNDRITTKQRYN